MRQSSSQRRLQRIDEEQRIAKANESSVRFLQLSLQLFFQWGYDSFQFLLPLGQFITSTKDDQNSHFLTLREHLQDQGEQSDYYTAIVQPLCMYWTLYNIFVLVGLKCVDELSKGSLIFTGVVNYLVALFIVILGFIENSTDDKNASFQIYHRYAPFQVLNCLTVVSLFYFTRAQEPRRFSTSPGNFVWVWLFLAWSWEQDIEGYMLAIGIIFCIITTTSVGMLLVELMKGLTTTVKKVLILQLVFSLVLTGLTEIFAVISHNAIAKIAQQETDEMIEDEIAVSLLQIFIIVNIVDMWFWIFGRCVTN